MIRSSLGSSRPGTSSVPWSWRELSGATSATRECVALSLAGWQSLSLAGWQSSLCAVCATTMVMCALLLADLGSEGAGPGLCKMWHPVPQEVCGQLPQSRCLQVRTRTPTAASTEPSSHTHTHTIHVSGEALSCSLTTCRDSLCMRMQGRKRGMERWGEGSVNGRSIVATGRVLVRNP